MIPDSCFSVEELNVLSFVPDEHRQECADWMYYLRQGMMDSGVEYCCTQVKATGHGCVLFVFPTSECSIPAFVRLLKRAVGKEARVWNHFPKRVEVAVEFETDWDWIARWDEFRKRDTWRKAVANPDSLPIALGIGMDGEDVVIDLAEMSGLAILGGDTLNQNNLLQDLMRTLYSVRRMPVVETYFMATDYVSLIGCEGFENAVAEMPIVNSLVPDGRMIAWANIVEPICRSMLKEISERKRLFRERKCYSIDEFNRHVDNPLKRILVVIFDPPSECGEGASRKAVDDMEAAVFELLYKCDPRFGIHMIIGDFAWGDPTQIRAAIQYAIAGRDPDVRVGCLMHNAAISSEDDSHRLFGGPEAVCAGGKTLLYRSPENEVYKVHKLGE